MASNIDEVSEILDYIGWGRYQVNTFFILGLCWCNMLAWQACISISLQEASSQWGLSSIQIGGIGSCHTFGILIGSYFWGYIGNVKGRLITLKLIFSINACIGFLYTFAINYTMLCISAVLIGFCGGGAQVLSGTLYMETLPRNKQWTMVLLTIFISIGGVLGYLIAIFVEASGTYSINIWRWVGGFDILLMITIAGLLLTIFESPKFLMIQNKEENAKTVLTKIAKVNGKDVKINFCMQDVYLGINQDSIEESKKSGKLMEIFNIVNMKQTIIITVCMFLSDISYSGLMEFMPILLTKARSGISNRLELYATILAQIFMGIPGSLISTYMVNTGYQKKWIIVFGFTLSGLATFGFLVAWEYWMVFLAVCLINLFNQMGYSSLLVLITESYNVEVRSLAVGWANAWCKFGGVISPVTLGVIFETQGNIILGVFILSIAFIAVGAVAILLKEPKTLTLLEKNDKN